MYSSVGSAVGSSVSSKTTRFYAVLRRDSSEWLELSIESDLGMRFGLDLAFHDFARFLQTLFLVLSYLLLFVIRVTKF